MHLRSTLLLVLLVGACGGDAGAPDALALDGPQIPDAVPPDALTDHGVLQPEATMMGTPAFEIVDWQLYATPHGGDDFMTTMLAIWSMHKDYPAWNTLGPDEVHLPPYTSEVSDSIAALGYVSGDRWAVSDWTYPRSLILSATMIPSATAPTGKSTDLASGPIIPETIFPITVNANLRKGTITVDPDFDSSYPAIDDILPSAQADGYSHMPLNFGEDTSYIPGTAGDYTYEVFVTDQVGNGWKVIIPFTVQ